MSQRETPSLNLGGYVRRANFVSRNVMFASNKSALRRIASLKFCIQFQFEFHLSYF